MNTICGQQQQQTRLRIEPEWESEFEMNEGDSLVLPWQNYKDEREF